MGSEKRPTATLEQLAQPMRLSTLMSADGDREAPDFKIFSGELQVLKAEDAGDGRRRLKCVASSTMKDLHGDTMTEHCIRSMAKQAPGLTIFLNHSYRIPEDVFGTVEKARTRRYNAASAKAAGISKDILAKAASTGSDVLLLELTVLVDDSNPRAGQSYSSVENGVTLGVSIGAMITDYDEDPEADPESWWPPLIINDVDLLEASIVGIPANQLSWVEGATKGLILKGAVDGADEDTFRDYRRAALLKEIAAAAKEESVEDHETEATAKGETEAEGEAAVEAAADPVVEASVEAEETPKFDGVDQIIAYYQSQVETGVVDRTDLDAMEEAVQEAIDVALENGADAAEFEGRTAKDLAAEILNSEPAPEEPDTAGEGENPSGDQEAPASAPESEEKGTEDAAEKAAAEFKALAESGVLDSLGEVFDRFKGALDSLQADNAAKSEQIVSLRAELDAANANVAAAVEFVDKVMALPWGRKSIVRGAAVGFADRLKGGPYSDDVLAYINKHTAGASDGS